MPRKAKQRKWDKNKARKQQTVAKTAASRERRLSNKHTRNEIHEVNRKAGQRHIDVIMVDQVPHERITATDDTGKEVTIVGGKIELINGIYTVIPTPPILDDEGNDDDIIAEQLRMQPYIDEEMGIFSRTICNKADCNDKIDGDTNNNWCRNHLYTEEGIEAHATGEITTVEPVEGPIRIGIRNDVAKRKRISPYTDSRARLAEQEEELRRQDHERASRPRQAIKVQKSAFDRLKDKIRGN